MGLVFKTGDIHAGSMKDLLDKVSRRAVVGALDAHGGNVEAAAEFLGMTREGLYKAMKRHAVAVGYGRK